MQVHPLTDMLDKYGAGLGMATQELVRSSDIGVHAILLCPLYRPDALECRIITTEDGFAAVPEGGTESIMGYGRADAAFAPATYGLAPCMCCEGERWRLIVPLLYVEAWRDIMRIVAELLIRDVVRDPSRYCANDIEATKALPTS